MHQVVSQLITIGAPTSAEKEGVGVGGQAAKKKKANLNLRSKKKVKIMATFLGPYENFDDYCRFIQYYY